MSRSAAFGYWGNARDDQVHDVMMLGETRACAPVSIVHTFQAGHALRETVHVLSGACNRDTSTVSCASKRGVQGAGLSDVSKGGPHRGLRASAQC